LHLGLNSIFTFLIYSVYESRMRIDHIFCKTSYGLIGRLIELCFDLVVGFIDDVISEIIGIGPFSSPASYLFMIIHYFFNLIHHHAISLGAAQIREELLNEGQLRHRHLIIELLMSGAMVLVI
jgi:hypothetical protein